MTSEPEAATETPKSDSPPTGPPARNNDRPDSRGGGGGRHGGGRGGGGGGRGRGRGSKKCSNGNKCRTVGCTRGGHPAGWDPIENRRKHEEKTSNKTKMSVTQGEAQTLAHIAMSAESSEEATQAMKPH